MESINLNDGTYTIPKDGIFLFVAGVDSGNGAAKLNINNVTVLHYTAGDPARILIPLKMGTNVVISTHGNGKVFYTELSYELANIGKYNYPVQEG